MHSFKILPIDHAQSPAEVTAPDAGSLLFVIERLDCGEADVLQDDVYSFSARLGANGLWSIFQREDYVSPFG